MVFACPPLCFCGSVLCNRLFVVGVWNVAGDGALLGLFSSLGFLAVLQKVLQCVVQRGARRRSMCRLAAERDPQRTSQRHRAQLVRIASPFHFRIDVQQQDDGHRYQRPFQFEPRPTPVLAAQLGLTQRTMEQLHAPQVTSVYGATEPAFLMFTPRFGGLPNATPFGHG